MKFEVTHSIGRPRTGILETGHGVIQTPAFMPVATAGSVKAIGTDEVKALGGEIILANAYHLYLRPGTEVLRKLKGLHRFITWDGPVLIDSGGFQILSLAGIREVSEEGVRFRSHIDGGYHMFTPEKVIEIQRAIGGDLVMPLDELVGWPAERKEADEAAERTWRWLQRSREAFQRTEPLYGHEQVLLPIVQGSFYPDQRKREAERVAALEPSAYAIGGLAVGEPPDSRLDAVNICIETLSSKSLRYAMGIGKPEDILIAVAAGLDLFDCVVPTRNGRNATLYTFNGKLNLRNARFAGDERPVEEDCHCPCCSHYSRAYLHHLYRSREPLALKLGSAHNLCFYFRLLEQIRDSIRRGIFHSWSADVVNRLGSRVKD